VVYRFARRRLHGDDELTREIVQATLCVALAKLRQFRGRAALTTWLCACCRNEIAAHYRRTSRDRARAADQIVDLGALAATGDGPERMAMRLEGAALVHRTLDELPRQYARVLEWKYLDELSVDQIAGRLERGQKAAESLLTRAREAFRVVYDRLAGRAEAADGMDDDESMQVKR
jgi:RNA polymerase sigma-70 factor (ECF subfamily)